MVISPKLLGLGLTADCPLNCSYCYVSKNGCALHMDKIVKAVDMFKSSLKTISFFGGEPLMEAPRLKGIVDYIRKTVPGISFGMTTNAVLITPDIAEFLADQDFSIIVSLDGPEKIHNFSRFYAQGKGSYARVIEGIEVLKAADAKISCFRGTFSPSNLFIYDRAKHLSDMCEKYGVHTFDLQPAYGPRYGREIMLDAEKGYLECVDLLVAQKRKKGKLLWHNINVFYNRLGSVQRHWSECGAGTGCVYLQPNGNFYACHRAGKCLIGSLEGGIDEDRISYWVRSKTALGNVDCARCNLLGICGGPCRSESLEHGVGFFRCDSSRCEFRKIQIGTAHTVRCIISRRKDNECEG